MASATGPREQAARPGNSSPGRCGPSNSCRIVGRMLDALRSTRARSYPFEGDLLLALLLAGWAQIDLHNNLAVVNGLPPLLPNIAVCLLQTVPLAWRRRAPLTVLLVV